jgi:hypothetical protein
MALNVNISNFYKESPQDSFTLLHHKIVGLLYAGKHGDAMPLIIKCLMEWQKFFTDNKDILVKNASASDINTFYGKLKELYSAFMDADILHVSDVLEFEIKPFVEILNDAIMGGQVTQNPLSSEINIDLINTQIGLLLLDLSNVEIKK